MVVLTTGTGTAVAINADLIESARESPPFTLVTLVDGKTFLVAESIEELVGRVASFRGAVLAAADSEHEGQVRPPVELRLVRRAAKPRVVARIERSRTGQVHASKSL